MRARRIKRVPTAAQLAVGASVLAFPATAVAFSHTGAHSTPKLAITALHATEPVAIRYGHRATVRGSVSISAAGVPIELRYRPADAHAWRVVARGHVHANGHFALTAALTRSGELQVKAMRALPGATKLTRSAPLFSAGVASGSWPTTTTSTASGAGPQAIVITSSRVRHLVVKPRLMLSGNRHSTTAIAGQPTQVRGHLLPGVPGRRVVLEVQQGRRWVSEGVARTRRGGSFNLPYLPAVTASQRIRVSFAGDHLNARANSADHSVIPMQYAEVSWYEDGGDTACGFHATYGIASRTLPCGTKVTLSYQGRSVVATVDDRGPFVYSRLYDLNQSTAAALGMDGVATVLASI
jgi:rare lipoprotein A